MIKIKLVIADTDERYINRLSDYIAFHYADQFEISVFTEPAIIPEFIATSSFHCMIATKEFFEAMGQVDTKGAFLLLHDGSDLSSDYNVKVIAKYQNVENILKEVKTVSADKVGFVPSSGADGKMQLYLAEGIAGGTGTTTVAIAFARYLARKGKRVLYLNLEAFGSVSNIFQSTAARDFSDVIYLLKAQKGNLELKIDGIVQKDIAGVCYIEPCKMAMDLLSLKDADVELLIDVLEQSGKYDYVIMDKDFGLSEMDFKLRKKASRMVYVSSGLPTQNGKFEKAVTALSMYGEKNGVALKEKAMLVYNKYSNRLSKKMDLGLQEALGFPRIDANDEGEIVEELAKKEGFQALI